MSRLTPAFLFVLSPCILCPSFSAAKSRPTISRITIRSTDIFDFETKPYLRKFPYTWINLLHIKTVDRIIEQELLFKKGEQMDEFLVQETERNLRALPFIRSARIAKFPQRDGTVAVVVYVSDSWTTEPQINLSGINNIDKLEFGFREKNLFGYGKSMEVKYRTDTDSDSIERLYRYTDPRLFGSRLQLKSEYENNTDEEAKRLLLERPFFSADTKWSSRATYDREEKVIEEFDSSNKKTSEFNQAKEVSQAYGGVKIGGGRRIVNRVGLRYKKEQQRFSTTDETSPARPIPASQDFQTVFLDYQMVRNNFIKTSRLERMTRIEDVNLGPVLLFSPGVSPKLLTGRENTTNLETEFRVGYLFPQSHLLQTRIRHTSRETFESATNERYEVDLKYYHRTSVMQTAVFHTRVEWGVQLDSDNLITLGGDNGLRAYEKDSIVGTRGFVFNAEDRLYLTGEMLNLFVIGGAFFYDAGYVWPKGEPIRLSDVRSSIGSGIRIALTRSSDEVILRLDLSYRLHRLRSDDDPWVISFGSDQAF